MPSNTNPPYYSTSTSPPPPYTTTTTTTTQNPLNLRNLNLSRNLNLNYDNPAPCACSDIIRDLESLKRRIRAHERTCRGIRREDLDRYKFKFETRSKDFEFHVEEKIIVLQKQIDMLQEQLRERFQEGEGVIWDIRVRIREITETLNEILVNTRPLQGSRMDGSNANVDVNVNEDLDGGETRLIEEGLLDASPFGTGTDTGGSSVNEDRLEAQARSQRLMNEDFQGYIRPVKPEKSASENSKYG